MALTTASAIRTNYIGADSSYDAVLTVLIAQATALMEKHCGQPLDQQTVTREVWGNGSQFVLLPYTVPVTLSTLEYKAQYDSAAWSTVTGAVIIKDRGTAQMYLQTGFVYPLYKATLSVGYSTVPADLVNVCSEMVVELFKASDNSRDPNRFGLSSIAGSEAGQSATTVFRDLANRYKDKLKPYKVRHYI